MTSNLSNNRPSMDEILKTIAYIALCVIGILALASCRSVRYVPVEKVSVKTEYIHSSDTILQVDTIEHFSNTIIREVDSVALAEMGIRLDGMKKAWLIEKNNLERQLSNMSASSSNIVERVDSVFVPQPFPVEKELSLWEKIKLKFFDIVVFVLIVLLVLHFGIKRNK